MLDVLNIAAPVRTRVRCTKNSSSSESGLTRRTVGEQVDSSVTVLSCKRCSHQSRLLKAKKPSLLISALPDEPVLMFPPPVRQRRSASVFHPSRGTAGTLQKLHCRGDER
jgi:hypothetical protein